MKVLAFLLSTTFSQFAFIRTGSDIIWHSVNQRRSQNLMQFLHHCKVMTGLSPGELLLFGFVDSQFFSVWCLGTVILVFLFFPSHCILIALFFYSSSSLFFFCLAQYHTQNQSELGIVFQDYFLNTFFK